MLPAKEEIPQHFFAAIVHSNESAGHLHKFLVRPLVPPLVSEGDRQNYSCHDVHPWKWHILGRISSSTSLSLHTCDSTQYASPIGSWSKWAPTSCPDIIITITITISPHRRCRCLSIIGTIRTIGTNGPLPRSSISSGSSSIPGGRTMTLMLTTRSMTTSRIIRM